MEQKYRQIAVLLFKHQYFKTKLFRSIEVSYDEITSKLATDLNIIIKPFLGGIYVLSSNPELLDTTAYETFPLRLHLSCKDPFFINYTDLPVYNLNDTVIYLNNLVLHTNTNEDETKLHKDKFIGIENLVKLNQGKINIPSYDPNQQYLFTDQFGQEISDRYIKQSTNIPSEFIVSGVPQGLIYLTTDSTVIKKIYYSPKRVWKKPMAIIEIYPSKLFEQYKESEKLEYTINFKNRETIWKYFFVSPLYQKFDNLSIINKEKQQLFNPPHKQQIMENTEALVFESKNKLPLSEFSNDNFQLVHNYDPDLRSGKVIIKNLIRASPEQLYRDETISNKPMFSHMYL